MKQSRFIFILLVSIASACSEPVRISQGTSDGQDAFVIETPQATYIYQKEAGGFASIFDSEGTDWIQFSSSDSAYYPKSADSDYRGLPNLVFRSEDGGAGHPGFTKMTSELIGTNVIRSVSKSGKWAWTWTFHATHAVFELEKIDPETPYWFLYEGPIAGNFNPETHYWGTELELPAESDADLVKGTDIFGNWQTAYFGDLNYSQTFFVHQVENDSMTDMFSYMGNTLDGNNSPDGMVVFGFGRDRNATPLLSNSNTFVIGFYPELVDTPEKHNKLLDYIQNLESE